MITTPQLSRCSDDQIESMLQTSTTVVVEFSTEWCTPCLLLKPVAAKLALEFQDVATFVAVDADECERFKAAHDLTEFPQLLIFRDGVLADRRVGYDTADSAEAFIVQALKPGYAGTRADQQFAVAAGHAHEDYRSSTAELEAEINRRMDDVAPIMDALEEELRAEQACGALDASGAMARRRAEWDRVSAPFRDKLDALRDATTSALAAYQAAMAEAVEAYAVARAKPVSMTGHVCGPNDLFCRLRVGGY